MNVNERDLLNLYNVTPAWYEATLQAQGGLCAICKQPQTAKHHSGTIRKLFIDHNHATGSARGLLCLKCNSSIGHIEKNRARAVNQLAFFIRQGMNEARDELQALFDYLDSYS